MTNKFPKAVFLQITNRCNSRCLICPYKDTYAKEIEQIMPLELFQKILEDLTPEYTGQIGMYLHCEPLFDKRLSHLITIAKALCPKCEIHLSTNAGLLTREKADELCNVPIDTMVFNINGGTKETYEKAMYPLKWDITIPNVKYFLEKYKKRSYINFVKTIENQNESKELKKIFPDVTIVDEYWAVNRGGSVEINKPADSKTKFEFEKKACFQLTTNMNILCDGSMLLCCNCWKKEVILGNANNKNILELWGDNSLSHHNYPICKKCN